MLFQEILFPRRYVSDIVQNVSFATILITRVSEGVLEDMFLILSPER